MERPNPATTAYFHAAVPEDPRARRGAMFGHPCAFVNGHMFFGTFGQSVVVRLGTERTAAAAKAPLRIFEPKPGRAWKEYVQVDAGTLPPATLAGLAREALDWTAKLPPKPAKKRAAAKASMTVAPAAKKPAPTPAKAKKPKPAAKQAAPTPAKAKKPAAKKPKPAAKKPKPAAKKAKPKAKQSTKRRR